jgi:hypothetical protein
VNINDTQAKPGAFTGEAATELIFLFENREKIFILELSLIQP